MNLLNTEARIAASVGNNSGEESHWAYRKIISKTLHDAAFDSAFSYIKPKTDLNSIQNGDYVAITREFIFCDFEYLDSLCAPKGTLEQINQLPLKKSSPSTTQKELNRQSSAQIRDLRQGTSLIKGIVPCSRMLTSDDGFVIPLEDQYFRVNPKGMSFKYGGKTTCVGLITNTIDSANNLQSKNPFSVIQSKVNDLLLGLLQTQNGKLYIIQPIAVFYGK